SPSTASSARCRTRRSSPRTSSTCRSSMPRCAISGPIGRRPGASDMASSETSVLIAGAGPVGLALACELGLRGIDCVLIEKRDGAITVPKMSAISPRNMEFCRRWGIADTVRTAVWPESRNADFVFLDHLRGRELARSRRPTSAQRGALALSPETACHCPQIYFDPILAARVKTLASVRLRYDTRLDGFTQDRDRVH